TLLTPAAPEASSITAGTLNARITSSGTTADRDTSWLATVRSWYPDIIFSVDKDPSELINTDCYDLLGKVEHRFTSQTTAAVTFLGSFDNLGYHSIKPDETVRSMAEETSAHVWLTAQTKWSDSASVRTILAVGRLWRDREGSISGDDILQISDSRGFNLVELKQDWRAALMNNQLRFGFDAKSTDARYDYTRSGGDIPAVDTHLRPHERSIALY